MGAIIRWCIKGFGRKIYQYSPHLSMELYLKTKAQDNIEWDSMMWVWISCHCNKQKSDYLKEGTSSNTDINWERLFYIKTPINGTWEVDVQ